MNSSSTNLLGHYGLVAEFGGVTLKAFFTPEEIAGVDEATFRERDRLGYRAKYIGRFAEFFTTHDPDEVDHASKAELMTEPEGLQYALFRRSDVAYWQGVADGGKAGESPLRAARREAAEEAGLAGDWIRAPALCV